MTHTWRVRRTLPARFGQRCRVVPPLPKSGKNTMGTVLVEFEDGRRVVTSRFSVRRIQ